MIPELGREWVRGPQWASPQARAAWEPVIEDAAAAWGELEVVSVSGGLRSAAMFYVRQVDLPRIGLEAGRQGLVVAPVSFQGQDVRVVLARPEVAAPALVAYHAGDDRTLGHLLGYPECCTEHFSNSWAQGQDHVARMVAGTGLDGPWQANIMFRYVGVRLVPWLPCSPTCKATQDWANLYLALGVKSGIWMPPVEAVLRLGVRWEARNRVAEVTTQPFRLWVGSDVREKDTRARKGEVRLPEPAPWRDNGFRDRGSMEEAHRLMAGVVGPVSSALDLGAGDGALLARLAHGGPGPWLGVEADEGRAARGLARHEGVQLLHGRIEELPGEQVPQVDVVLVAVHRFLEMDTATAQAVRQALAGRRVVAYTYGDGGKGLAELAAKAGLRVLGPVTMGAGSTQVAEVATC